MTIIRISKKLAQERKHNIFLQYFVLGKTKACRAAREGTRWFHWTFQFVGNDEHRLHLQLKSSQKSWELELRSPRGNKGVLALAGSPSDHLQCTLPNQEILCYLEQEYCEYSSEEVTTRTIKNTAHLLIKYFAFIAAHLI